MTLEQFARIAFAAYGPGADGRRPLWIALATVLIDAARNGSAEYRVFRFSFNTAAALGFQQFGHIGYDAFARAASWTGPGGATMLPWFELTAAVRHRWTVAVAAIIGADIADVPELYTPSRP